MAYDALHGLSSKLRSSTDASFDGIYHKLLTMVSSVLSHSSFDNTRHVKYCYVRFSLCQMLQNMLFTMLAWTVCDTLILCQFLVNH